MNKHFYLYRIVTFANKRIACRITISSLPNLKRNQGIIGWNYVFKTSLCDFVLYVFIGLNVKE